jgi:hypothetical protein
VFWLSVYMCTFSAASESAYHCLYPSITLSLIAVLCCPVSMLAVDLLDRFLSAVPIARCSAGQLVGAACLWLAR